MMPSPSLGPANEHTRGEGQRLLQAVKAGREDEVHALLTRGCRLEAARDESGRTALHWACQHGHLAILRLLLSYVPIKITSCSGSSSSSSSSTTSLSASSSSTPSLDSSLCSSSSSYSFSSTSSLSSVKATSTPEPTSRCTAIAPSFSTTSPSIPTMSTAVSSYCPPSYSFARPDSSSSSAASFSPSPSNFASLSSSSSSACVVCTGSAVTLSKTPESGLTRDKREPENGMHDDRTYGRGTRGNQSTFQPQERVCICHDQVTSPSCHVINALDVKGQTALHVACNFRHPELASLLVTLPECDVNCADQAGNTPLHRAIHNELDNLACLLCEAGADVRAANHRLQTPLHEAVRVGCENVVRALLTRGSCDVNAVTDGAAATTPFLTGIFHYRISSRTSSYGRSLDTILSLLIEAGCRLSQGDRQWTPLSASVDVDNSFIASLLLYNGCRVPRGCTTTSTDTNTTTYTTTNTTTTARAPAKSLLVETFARCEPHVVRMLVLCGYQPTLEEVDQCSRRIPAFSPLFYRISGLERVAAKSRGELLVWLRQRATCACSMLELSRVKVRAVLNEAAGDASILKRVQELPLPAGLMRYVALSDFTSAKDW